MMKQKDVRECDSRIQKDAQWFTTEALRALSLLGNLRSFWPEHLHLLVANALRFVFRLLLYIVGEKKKDVWLQIYFTSK